MKQRAPRSTTRGLAEPVSRKIVSERGAGQLEFSGVFHWLRPTRLTWIPLSLPLVVWLGLVSIGRHGAAVFMLLLAIEPSFYVWRALGVTMGRHTDFYGWPDPSPLGWILIALTDLAAWYVIASAIVAIVGTTSGAVRRARQVMRGPDAAD
jgi:hypothetical protein